MCNALLAYKHFKRATVELEDFVENIVTGLVSHASQDEATNGQRESHMVESLSDPIKSLEKVMVRCPRRDSNMPSILAGPKLLERREMRRESVGIARRGSPIIFVRPALKSAQSGAELSSSARLDYMNAIVMPSIFTRCWVAATGLMAQSST